MSTAQVLDSRGQFVITLLMVWLVASAPAAQSRPTDEEFAAAIARAQQVKNRSYGLQKKEPMRNDGFSILVHSPLSMVAQFAYDRARKYQSTTIADLPNGLRAAVLAVRAYPDTPEYMTARSIDLSSSVSHVVLMDRTQGTVIQPVSTKIFNSTFSNSVGGTVTYTGVDAIFKLDDVHRVQALNEDREFDIVIVGSRRKDPVHFKISRADLEFIP